MISATVQIQAQFYHLDPMEVVWHGNYVRFFEQARCALLDKIDYNYPQMRDSGYMWPIVDMRVKFVRPVRFAQVIDVCATLAEHENRLKINYLITDAETGEKITKGFTIQVAIDGETQEMVYESPAILFEKVREAECKS
jgi:acyl-CoA thioester hydrolase